VQRAFVIRYTKFQGGTMFGAGQNLRGVRERLGLTMRDVESASARIAQRHDNEEFLIGPSRLSDIETKGIVPSIYRIYALSIIYRRDLHEILRWYGVDANEGAADLGLALPPKSHRMESLQNTSVVQMPTRLDPSFDTRRTSNVGRMIEQWGAVPLSYLAQFVNHNFTYGYIGSEDFTMYPILPPGTFIQVDESRNKVMEGVWRSEYERPIYFVETRDGHTCCWCTLKRESLILQPHPLSPVSVRVLRHPQEAEIVGQVVGVAMRLGEWQAIEALQGTKERASLS
jgi:transcriptional regulator with XRE-family HTH domain